MDYTAFGVNVALSGAEVLIAVLSTYVLAFVQADRVCLTKLRNGGGQRASAHILSVYMRVRGVLFGQSLAAVCVGGGSNFHGDIYSCASRDLADGVFYCEKYNPKIKRIHQKELSDLTVINSGHSAICLLFSFLWKNFYNFIAYMVWVFYFIAYMVWVFLSKIVSN